jgi:hypothetical protein
MFTDVATCLRRDRSIRDAMGAYAARPQVPRQLRDKSEQILLLPSVSPHPRISLRKTGVDEDARPNLVGSGRRRGERRSTDEAVPGVVDHVAISETGPRWVRAMSYNPKVGLSQIGIYYRVSTFAIVANAVTRSGYFCFAFHQANESRQRPTDRVESAHRAGEHLHGCNSLPTDTETRFILVYELSGRSYSGNGGHGAGP